MSGNLDPELRARSSAGRWRRRTAGPPRAVGDRLDGVPDDPLATTLYIDGQLALVDDMLHYFDRTSMAHSLEVRVPFLDHQLVEFSATVPARMKVRRLTTKYLLKRVASGLLPEQIVNKPKIGLFNAAIDSWFAAHAQEAIQRYLLQPDPAYAEILDP